MSEGINLGLEGVKHPYGVSPVEQARYEFIESEYGTIFGADDMENSPSHLSREVLKDILVEYSRTIATAGIDEERLRESLDSKLYFEEVELMPGQLTFLLMATEKMLYEQGILAEEFNDF